MGWIGITVDYCCADKNNDHEDTIQCFDSSVYIVQAFRHSPSTFTQLNHHHGHFVETNVAISVFVESVEDLFYLSLVVGSQDPLDVLLIQGIVPSCDKRVKYSTSEGFRCRPAFQCLGYDRMRRLRVRLLGSGNFANNIGKDGG